MATRFGVRSGNRVAVLSRRSGNLLEAQFACWTLGAVFVPVKWRLAVPELEYITAECQPRILLRGNEFGAAAAALTQVPHQVAWATGDDGPNDYEQLLASVPAGELPPAENTCTPPCPPRRAAHRSTVICRSRF